MFVTQLGTRFEVNSRFFDRLAMEGAGKAPAAAVAPLHALDGKSFASAKEFLKAVTDSLGRERARQMEPALMAAARSDNRYWIAVLLIALAAASHQAWSANIFTLVSDVFPKKATASVTGIGGMVGAVAGIIADRKLGQVLTASGPSGYFFAFLLAGSAYLILLGVAHVLMPHMTPLDENLRPVPSAHTN
jgi:hypothetical protein